MPQQSSNGTDTQFRSKSSWAYETIRGMIWNGDLAAGTKLDQQALATRLGISTTPLREALRRLEAEDYIQSEDHKEMRVTPLSLEIIEDLYAVRLQLDPFAARLACERMTGAQVRAVRALLPPERGLSNLEYSSRNRVFHRAIYMGSGNAALTRVLEGLRDQTDRWRVAVLEDAEMEARTKREHSQMCDLLEAGDSVGLAALMREHLTGTLEQYRRSASKSPSLTVEVAESHEAAASA